MFLKYSDVSWSEFRLAGLGSRVLRASDLTTRYVYGAEEEEVLHAPDYMFLMLHNPVAEELFSFDSVLLSYSGVFAETCSTGELFSVRASLPFVDICALVEVASVRFSSPFAEAVLSGDRVFTNFHVVIRDAVGLNEAFFFGGVFNVDVNNIVFLSDAAAGRFTSPSSDLASVNEVVRVGLRHMIDFYLGGFALGSVVLGGRLR